MVEKVQIVGYINPSMLFSLPKTQQPQVGHGVHIIEAPRSHSDTSHSVALLWKGDQPISETCT